MKVSTYKRKAYVVAEGMNRGGNPILGFLLMVFFFLCLL